MGFRIAAAAVAFGLASLAPAQAAPCMTVTVTGAQGGPQAYQGQAGPGTLVHYGDDADNCRCGSSSMRGVARFCVSRKSTFCRCR